MLKHYSLSESLRKTWATYEKKIQLTRNHTSPKNVHQLRVSTQRVQAVLTLANSLHSTRHSKNIIVLIKSVRKSLGPLRDIQVESTALENLKEKGLSGRKRNEFSSFFALQKNKAKRKAKNCLEKISIKKERKGIEKLAQKLKKLELSKAKAKIQSKLDLKMKSSVRKFNEVMKNLNPNSTKEIHQFRIMAKKLRYQGEFVNSLTGFSKYDLPHLMRVQFVAGRIQNDTILISTLERFLAKKRHKDDPKALKIKKRIEDNQSKLIKKDFSQLSAIR